MPPNTISELGHKRSALVLPVFDPPGSGRVTAVFNIEFDRTDALTREQIDWLSAFVMPSNRLLPPSQRHNFVSCAQADAEIVAQLLRELRVNWGLTFTTLSSADQLNAHDALIVVYSSASVSSSEEYLPFDLHRLPLWQGIITVIVSGTMTPWPHSPLLNRKVVDLRSERAHGLKQLAGWLDPEGGLAHEPEASPASESPDTAPDNVVRVTYATDRETLPDSGLTYGTKRVTQLQFGESTVKVPPTHRLGKLEEPSLLRLEFRTNPQKHFEIRDTRPLSQDEFANSHPMKLSAADLPVVLYVPGFNLSFEGMVLRAAQISFDLKAQVMVYAWPSQGKVSGYMADMNTLEMAAPKLAQLLGTFFINLPRKPHLWADGLGANALIGALSSPSPQSLGTRFGQIIFTHPDVDFDRFEHVAPTLALTADRVTAYVWPGNPASLATARLHEAPRAATVLRAVRGVDTIDTSADESNLGLLADIFQLITRPRAPDQRFGLHRVDSESGPLWQLGKASSNAARAEDLVVSRLRIFISYVHSYAEHAKELAAALSPHVDVDWDRNLRAGDDWGQELPRLLEDADAVVALVGPLTEKSHWASQEISRAFELKKRLIPVAVDPFQQPDALLRLMFANIDQDGRVSYLARISPHDMPTVIRATAKNIVKALRVAQ